MNYLFIPAIILPLFSVNSPEPVAYIQYAPVHVYGPQVQERVFITQDYHPYTHGFLPEDGSEDKWGEQNS